MRNGFRLLSVLFAFVLLLTAQLSLAQRAIIENLKKNLSSRQGRGRVDGLNVLSLAYSTLNADSASAYAYMAGNEAAMINYLEGEAMAMNNKAHIAGLDMRNFPQQEKLSRLSIAFCQGIHNNKLLADSYMNLALALFCQSDFQRSAGACDTVLQLSGSKDDKTRLGEAAAMLGAISFETGNYEQSFEYYRKGLGIFKSIDDSYNTAILLAKMGDLYCLAGDKKTGLDFYFQSLQYDLAPSLTWHPLADLGDTYYLTRQNDPGSYEQEKYIQTIKSLTIRSNFMSFASIRKAEQLIAANQPEKALSLLFPDLRAASARHDKNLAMRLLLDISTAYGHKKDYAKALAYGKALVAMARAEKTKPYLRDGFQLLYKNYDQLKERDSAYAYYRDYTQMKDSVALGEFSKKLALHMAASENEKKEAQIELLKKEKLASGQQLKNESLMRNILGAGVLILLLLGFIIFRNFRLKQTSETNRHKLETIELELQALRAQMSPHFIFNCLNSINRYMLANEKAKSADYLTKFSKLIRIVLQQSGKSFVPLEDELYSLRLYMELEALRFKVPFIYEIDFNGINTTDVALPPMLLQPFVENAIWHGLHPKKDGQGRISIRLQLQDEQLNCTITDNGVGRPRPESGQPIEKKSSMGIQLTRDRLDLLKTATQKTMLGFHDLTNKNGFSSGTRVELKIPVKVG